MIQDIFQLEQMRYTYKTIICTNKSFKYKYLIKKLLSTCVKELAKRKNISYQPNIKFMYVFTLLD